ncbi:MAG: hypothetical protein AAF581_05030 [Planctomycetota bacterium]
MKPATVLGVLSVIVLVGAVGYLAVFMFARPEEAQPESWSGQPGTSTGNEVWVEFEPAFDRGSDVVPLRYFVKKLDSAQRVSMRRRVARTLLPPGRYAAFAVPDDRGGPNLYGEASFVVEDAAVRVPLPVRKGCRVTVHVPSSAKPMLGLLLVPLEGSETWRFGVVSAAYVSRIAPDGTASFSGVPPGLDFSIRPLAKNEESRFPMQSFRGGPGGREVSVHLDW